MSAQTRTQELECLPTNTGTLSQLIPIEEIARNPRQPRRDFDEEALERLAQSIAQEGQLQPVALRRADVMDPDDLTRACRYELILGERRWRAMRRLKATHIEAKVYEGLDAVDVQVRALVENLQREQLNAMEEADGLAEMESCGLTQEQIAQRVGRSRPSVANALRLRKLPDSVQLNIRMGRLTAAHGMALLRFAAWPKVCAEIARRALEEKATAGDLESETAPYFWDMRNDKPPGVERIEDAARALVARVCGSMKRAVETLPWLFEQKHRYGGSDYWSMDPPASQAWVKAEQGRLQQEETRKLEAAKTAAAQAKQAGKPVPKKVAAVLEAAKAPGGRVNAATGKRGMSEAEKKERARKIAENRRRREAAQVAQECAARTIAAIAEVRSIDLARIVKWAIKERYNARTFEEALRAVGVENPGPTDALEPLEIVKGMLMHRVILLAHEAAKYAHVLPAEVSAYALPAKGKGPGGKGEGPGTKGKTGARRRAK